MAKMMLGALAGLFLMTAVAAPTWAVGAKEGDAVPEFSITMLSGKTASIAEMQKSNKTIVITFIQTACSSCKGEIIELNKLAKQSKANVVVVPVAVDMRSGKDFLENYKTENAVDFDFGIDPKFSIPIKFGITFTPATVVIQDGKVAKIFRGYDEAVQGELAKLFN